MVQHEVEQISGGDLLALLDRDPQEGMVRLVEQYTGLLWSVAQKYLQSPEDIKECVNDTFAEFWFHRDRYDPERGTLAAFLGTIAKNQAIDRYRRASGRETLELLEEAAADPRDLYGGLENEADLERALAELKPLDVEIIRMKYYGGMTVPEIAEALGLPFAAVKKRHQRSLKKLRALLLGLLLALVLAALTACAYVVLRYFGVIPGYAVTGNPEEQVYILEDGPRDEGSAFLVVGGFLQNGEAHIIMYCKPPLSYESLLDPENSDEAIVAEYSDLSGFLNGQEADVHVGWGWWDSYHGLDPYSDFSEGTVYQLEVHAHVRAESQEGEAQTGGDGLEDLGETVVLQFSLLGEDLSFRMRRARVEDLSEHSFQIEDRGGLLAVPRLEDGRLIVGVYPLNTGAATLMTTLTRGRYMEGEDGVVTVTAPDGRELTGECMYHTSLNSGQYFYDWDFGPAEAGKYTLHVPYVYLTLPVEEPFTFKLDLAHDVWEPWEKEVTGGVLALEGLERIEGPVPGYEDTVAPDGTRASGWRLLVRYTQDGGDLTLSTFLFHWPYGMASMKVLSEEIMENGASNIVGQMGFQVDGGTVDPEKEVQELIIRGWEDCFDPAGVTLTLDGELSLRWNQPFDIPLTVE